MSDGNKKNCCHKFFGKQIMPSRSKLFPQIKIFALGTIIRAVLVNKIGIPRALLNFLLRRLDS